jgi:membrane-bound serine protease (ClpP class)
MSPHERRSVQAAGRTRERSSSRRGTFLLHRAWLAVLAGLLLAAPSPSRSAAAQPTVARCELTGTVDAGSSAYLQSCIQRAHAAGHEALLIRVDTPGGSLDATRGLVGALLNAPLPVLVWVGPAGARAGSAGVFVALAAHVSAMAPGTNIGAAHPVMGPSGADPEAAGGKTMAKKVENDTVAFAQAIARERGRNEEWAAAAVRESESVLAARAVELRVVDLVATSEAELLAMADGRGVRLPSGEHRLSTRDAQLVTLAPALSHRVVHALANPTVAYLLFLVGAFLLVTELSNPGTFVPGILGGTCLVLALIAFSALPIRAGAILLLVFGVALIVAELFTAHGALALGGTVLLALGGALLIDRTEPGWLVDRTWGLPLQVILPTVAVIGGGAVYLVFKAAQTRRLPQRAGAAGLVGELGRVLLPLSAGGGEVFVHGERWRALAERDLPAGAEVVVRRVDGLTLFVEEVNHVGRSVRDPDPVGNPVHGVHVGGPDHQRV